MTAYVLDPAELAFEQIRQELKGELKSVTDYVFAYDAWLQQDDGPRPLLVFQMEHTGAPCSVQLGQLYDLDRPSPRAKPKVILRGELQPIGDSDAWLA